MKIFICALMTLSSLSVFSATFESLEKATRYELTRTLMEDACDAREGNYDCYSHVIKVKSMNKSEKWVDVITKYLRGFEVSQVEKSQFANILEGVAEAASIPTTSDEFDALYERIENDVNNNVLIFSAQVWGEFNFNHTIFILVDLDNQEFIVFEGGYSE